LYVILADRRDELVKYLAEQGIETVIHYPTPLPALPAYRYLNYTTGDFPIATFLQKKILSLPMYPELTEDQIRHIAECIRIFYAR
jgi:dTDP-4-amino-4,6-dideoxygalactose transaminase